MRRRIILASLSLVLILAYNTMASEPRYQQTDGDKGMLYGGSGTAKAARDTTFLLGGPAAYTGKFEDQFAVPSWHGWTHTDATNLATQRWNVSSFRVPAGGGNLAMWCGQEDYPNACTDGYGNDWNESLVFTYTVANPDVNTTVRLQCIYNFDTEEGFDYFRIQQNRGGIWENIIQHSGLGTASFDQNITYTPDDYVGPAGDVIELRFLGVSDGAWSDEDCLLDTQGLAQVDNIRVTIGGDVFYEDHEDGDNDYWEQVFPVAVGDFAKIWANLGDADPCVTNLSPQVAFIDDGIVVPGTGGTPCVTWCYGPGGYVVNNTGGLAGGPDDHINNLILSPVLEWPAGNDGAILTFTVYRHEEAVPGISPGIYYQWHVRSAVNPADLPYAAWQDRNFVYRGGPDYIRNNFPVTDLLEPGRTVVQIGLRCIEYGWVFGIEGVDGTPAPYFDNVVLRVYPAGGPAMSARDIDLANDSFPERGDIDLTNLANNWVRFDMARSISQDAHLRNDPGDSIFVDIGLPRAGSVLNEMPKLVVKMKANPLFNGVRVLPPGFTLNAGIIDGFVYGDSTRQPNGTVVADRYNFDLPDSNFFFPGDVIHYYIEASDNLNGDIGTTTLPADISDVGDFDGVSPYEANSTFIVRALPTLFDVAGNQPEILFWNDFANRGGEDEWYFALNNLGYNEHVDYDVYYTNGPTSGVGNGLGGRATSQTMGGYNTLLYTAGDLSVYTIANGDFASDPSNDIGVLNNWFASGDKSAFMTGDDLVFSLNNSGGGALAFAEAYLSASLVNNNLLPLINNQTAPMVRPIVGNSVFTTPDEWVAYGGCPIVNDFDAIEANGAAERIAQFMTPSGNPGYSYAAGLRYTNVGDVILLPYDFSFIYNTPDYVPSQPGYSVRTEVLRDVLIEFGHIPGGTVIDVPPSGLVFGVTSYPNPFNPKTEIALTLPQPGVVSLKIYNVRGELVRTLIHGELAAGVQKVEWNGTSDAGRPVASGVYFYETRYNGETTINKVALVR